MSNLVGIKPLLNFRISIQTNLKCSDIMLDDDLLGESYFFDFFNGLMLVYILMLLINW